MGHLTALNVAVFVLYLLVHNLQSSHLCINDGERKWYFHQRKTLTDIFK